MDIESTPKRPPGRPRKSPPKVRVFTRPKVLEKTSKLEIKMPESDRNELRRIAEIEGTTESAFARAAIMEKIAAKTNAPKSIEASIDLLAKKTEELEIAFSGCLNWLDGRDKA